MRQAWDYIRQLTEANATHRRKGWRLGEITPEQELKDAAGELLELAAAKDGEDMDELADVLGWRSSKLCYANWSSDSMANSITPTFAALAGDRWRCAAHGCGGRERQQVAECVAAKSVKWRCVRCGLTFWEGR